MMLCGAKPRQTRFASDWHPAPHIETTRLIARRFTDRYGPLFSERDPVLSSTPLLVGLDGERMGKSRGNGIALSASEDDTAAIVQATPTDSERRITYEPRRRRSHVANLLDLLSSYRG